MTPKPDCDPQAVVEFLRALAHPMRLQILERLLDGELAVSGFEQELGLKQPNLSQQLGALREAGLVTTRREAKSIVYSIADDRVAPMLNALNLTPGTASPRVRLAPPTTAVVRPNPAVRTAQARGLAASGSSVFGQVGWHL